MRENLRKPHAPFHAVSDWLLDQLTLPVARSDLVRVVHSSTPVADGESIPREFTLLGSQWAADVALRDSKLQVTRLIEVSRRRGERWPRLSYVPVSSERERSGGQASEALRAALAGLVEERRPTWNYGAPTMSSNGTFSSRCPQSWRCPL